MVQLRERDQQLTYQLSEGQQVSEMELERLRRQLSIKEQAVRELKAINDTYKSKCELLENDMDRLQD
jgi:hypothetical protein